MKRNNRYGAVHDPLRWVVIEHALLRWESAVVIALTILLTALCIGLGYTGRIPDWSWLAALLFGLVGEALLIVASLTDPASNRQLVITMLGSGVDPNQFNSTTLQQKVMKSFEYRARLEAAINRAGNKTLKRSLREIAYPIERWIRNIYRLAERLDTFQEQTIAFQRDKGGLRKRIAELERRFDKSNDLGIRRQIQGTLDGMQRQLEVIKRVESAMARADLQLEHSVASLGTLYSQAILMEAQGIEKGGNNDLQREIAEEVEELEQILSAMDRVYADKQNAGGVRA